MLVSMICNGNQDIICTMLIYTGTLIVVFDTCPCWSKATHTGSAVYYKLLLFCFKDYSEIFQGDLILHSDRVVENVTKIVIHGKKSDACRVISETR